MHARTLIPHNKGTETCRQWPLQCPKTGPVHKNSSLGSEEKLEKKQRGTMNFVVPKTKIHPRFPVLSPVNPCVWQPLQWPSFLPRVSWGDHTTYEAISPIHTAILTFSPASNKTGSLNPQCLLNICLESPNSKVSTHPNNIVSNIKYFKLR